MINSTKPRTIQTVIANVGIATIAIISVYVRPKSPVIAIAVGMIILLTAFTIWSDYKEDGEIDI